MNTKIKKCFNRYLAMICLSVIGSIHLLAQEPNAQIKKVHLIFKTHLDIGYTDLSSKVERRYIEEFIPKALDVIDQLRAEGAEERYVWTTGSWLVWEYLQQASPEAVKRLEAAIIRGDIVWIGVPYTVHSEMMSRELFATCLKRSQQLDQRFGKKTIAAKMTDVPGHTRSIVSLLNDAGITMLHIGVNFGSALPVVPSACRWINSDGKDILLLYQWGYSADTVLPDGETVLSINFTGDNHGPHPLNVVKEIYATTRIKYPNAKIEASSFNEVAGDLQAMKDRLPVVTSEIGDTWVHGFGSSPLRMSRYRELSRLYTQWLQNGKLDANSPQTIDFAVKLGMVAEHTWGLNVRRHLQNWDKYDVDEFRAARNTEAFKYIEQSWAEIDAYIDEAVALLPPALQQEARKSLKEIEKPAALKITGNDRHPQLNENGSYYFERAETLTISPPLGDLGGFIGELAYLTFSGEDYVNYRNNYTANPVYQSRLYDFGKYEIENSKAKSATVVAAMQNCKVTKSKKNTVIQCLLKFPENKDIDPRVLPESAFIEYTIAASGNKIDMKVTLINKPAVRLPEAYMLSFVPSGIQCILAEKTGFMVDVMDVVEGGNRQMHAIDNYINIITDKGTVRIISLDAPLAAIGERKMLNYSTNLPDISGGVHFCLFNNLWGTNFTMWWEGSVTYRFTVEVKKAVSSPNLSALKCEI